MCARYLVMVNGVVLLRFFVYRVEAMVWFRVMFSSLWLVGFPTLPPFDVIESSHTSQRKANRSRLDDSTSSHHI